MEGHAPKKFDRYSYTGRRRGLARVSLIISSLISLTLFICVITTSTPQAPHRITRFLNATFSAFFSSLFFVSLYRLLSLIVAATAGLVQKGGGGDDEHQQHLTCTHLHTCRLASPTRQYIFPSPLPRLPHTSYHNSQGRIIIFGSSSCSWILGTIYLPFFYRLTIAFFFFFFL